MIETIISQNKSFLDNAILNREKYFSTATAFTRIRKLDYRALASFIINLPRKSLAVELEEFLVKLGKPTASYTKSALSHARAKLKPLFFKDWYENQNRHFYELASTKTWNGFRLLGIDGSRAALANTPCLVDEFGTQDNQYGAYPMCQYLFGHDVLNNLCCYSDIAPVKTSETAMLLPWLDQIPSDTLCIYDRLFVSAMLIFLHQKKNIPFLMRCKLSHNQVVRDFVASGAIDEIVTFKLSDSALQQLRELGYAPKQTGVSLRLIRVILDTGEVEVLATSLMDKDLYPASEFKYLYSTRWGVETSIGCLKNQLQIELASGLTPLAIQQDFFATIFTYNLQSIFIYSLQDEVDQINEKRKHNYQINRNVTLGILKIHLLRLFIQPTTGLTEYLQQRFMQHLTESIKHQGVKNPRNKKAQRLRAKYKPLKNYKRAI